VPFSNRATRTGETPVSRQAVLRLLVKSRHCKRL